MNPKQKLAKVHEVEQNGSKLICAETKEVEHANYEYCVDSANGTLARAPSFSGYYPKMVNEYGEYTPWGNLEFPHSIRVLRDGQLVAEWLVDELAPAPNPDPFLSAPPAGIKVRYNPNCGGSKIEQPKLIFHPTPEYPQSAKDRRISGTVRLFAIIGTDGLPHALSVIQSGGAELDTAALEAASKWRYHPTTCNGMPVDVETEIDVKFALP